MAGPVVQFGIVNAYWNEIYDARDDYDDNTDLTVSSNSSIVQDVTVAWLEGDFGTDFYARAKPKSDGTACTNNGQITGYCNTTNHLVDYAQILVNTNSAMIGFVEDHAQTIMRHEFGHVVGMAHGSCSETSIMRSGGCSEFLTSLATHDISFVNSNY